MTGPGCENPIIYIKLLVHIMAHPILSWYQKPFLSSSISCKSKSDICLRICSSFVLIGMGSCWRGRLYIFDCSAFCACSLRYSSSRSFAKFCKDPSEHYIPERPGYTDTNSAVRPIRMIRFNPTCKNLQSPFLPDLNVERIVTLIFTSCPCRKLPGLLAYSGKRKFPSDLLLKVSCITR